MLEEIVGTSAPLRAALARVSMVGPTDLDGAHHR